MTRLSGRILLCLAMALLTGCQQKMANQPSYKPLEATTFFPDGKVAQLPVPGTVARGHLRTDLPLFTGKTGSETRDWLLAASLVGAAQTGGMSAAATALAAQPSEVDTFPCPITRDVLWHGHNRYMIYCVVCHDPLGTGQGKIVERGYTRPPSYHIERLRTVPVGHFFDVITRGYGSMPSYGEQIPPRDRWAIAAYIRALQLSQHFPANQVTEAMRREWDRSPVLKPEERNP